MPASHASISLHHTAPTKQPLPASIYSLRSCSCPGRLHTQVFGVATLASVTPAQPFVFRNYELPLEADELARGMRASMGSSRHYVWQVGAGLRGPEHVRLVGPGMLCSG